MRAFLPADGERGQSHRHGGVGRPRRVSPGDRGRRSRRADVDALIVVFTPIDRRASRPACSPAIQAGIAAARGRRSPDKPVLACVMAGLDATICRCAASERDRSHLRVSGERRPGAGQGGRLRVVAIAAGRAVLGLRRHACRRGARDLSPGARRRGDTWLGDDDVWGVLNAFGVPVAMHNLARTADEAAAFASVIGFPVAAKLASTKVHAQDRARGGPAGPGDGCRPSGPPSQTSWPRAQRAVGGRRSTA